MPHPHPMTFAGQRKPTWGKAESGEAKLSSLISIMEFKFESRALICQSILMIFLIKFSALAIVWTIGINLLFARYIEVDSTGWSFFLDYILNWIEHRSIFPDWIKLIIYYQAFWIRTWAWNWAVVPLGFTYLAHRPQK